MRARIPLVLCLVLCIGVGLGSLQCARKQSREERRQQVHAQYRELANLMFQEYMSDPLALGTPSEQYHRHTNYAKILALGKGVIPLVIADLRDGKEREYPVYLLDDLLPNVDLGQLYGEKMYKEQFDVHRAYWLRWWDEHGVKQNWDE